ncbi:MAG TPA: hypothetical protein VF574_11940 [Allosphingosinicella sp.]|jgi:hypothetical protein
MTIGVSPHNGERRIQALPQKTLLARTVGLFLLLGAAAVWSAADSLAKPAPAVGAEDRCVRSAVPFWAKFQAAARRRSAADTALLARFPLSLRPILDDAPAQRLGATEFRRRYNEFLAMDSGEFEEIVSMAQLIQQTSHPKTMRCDGASGEFNLGRFVFEYSSSEWKLVTIFH